jgi:sodium transport system ATP-binding protein
MIAIHDLARSFGAVRAVDGVSFDVASGSIVGLLGPNGAGKTTTLRILSTLVRPDRGTATVGGFDVTTHPAEVRRLLGVVPDAKGLYPRLTSRENIRYYGRLHGLEGAALETAIDRLIGILDMAEIADRRTEGFSTGQRVKVAIARALVHGPKAVLLDEPTSGLDIMATRAMRDVIRRLRDDGTCVLLSTHIMQEVAALCDRVVVIAHGRVMAVGSPDELRAQTGRDNLEDAFVDLIGTEEGLQ